MMLLFQEKMRQESSQGLREERTCQLNRAVAADWDYQVEFNRRRKQEEQRNRTLEALETGRISAEEIEKENQRLVDKERHWEMIRRWVS